MKFFLPVVLAILVSPGFGCLSKNEAPSPSTTTTPTATTTSTTTTPQPVTTTSKPRSSLNGLVHFSERGVSLDYPEIWTKVTSTNTDTDLIVEFKTRHEGVNIIAQMIVRISKTVYTQDQYNTFIKATIESYGPKKDWEEYSLTHETFASLKNVLHLKSTNTKEFPTYADSYTAIKNGVQYTISYQSTDMNVADDVAQYSQVLRSFRIK
jgi:hypothetical protein